MPDRRGHKLRNIILHEFLDCIRQLCEPLIAPFIVPFDDLDSPPRLGLPLNECGDLFFGSARGDKILEVVSGDLRKSEKEVIERAVKGFCLYP